LSLNSTSFYRQTGWLELDIPRRGGNADGEPYQVSVHVFNFHRRIAAVTSITTATSGWNWGRDIRADHQRARTRKPSWSVPDDTTGHTWDDASATRRHAAAFPGGLAAGDTVRTDNILIFYCLIALRQSPDLAKQHT
jgi:hypothetical protein